MIEPRTKILIEELYVVADFGYHGQPGSDRFVYLSKEEAQAAVDKIKAVYPNLRNTVMDLQSYIWENRRYTAHQCEIC